MGFEAAIMEKLSIVIPVYNAENYLDRCLESVCNQSFYCNIEIIIVNDASTDSSKEVCDSWQKKDVRVKVIHKKENTGVADTRNFGIKEAEGKYLTFIDSDDFIDASCIKKLINIMEQENADIVRTPLCTHKNGKKEVKNIKCKKMTGAEYFLQEYTNKTYTVFVMGSLYNLKFIRDNNLWFDDKLRNSEDDLWTMQVLFKAKKVVISREALYHRVWLENSLSHSQGNMRQRGKDCLSVAKSMAGIVVDRRYRTAVNNCLIGLYYYGTVKGRLYETDKKLLSKRFALQHGLTKKNFIRTILFLINFKLFAVSNYLYECLQKLIHNYT